MKVLLTEPRGSIVSRVSGRTPLRSPMPPASGRVALEEENARRLLFPIPHGPSNRSLLEEDCGDLPPAGSESRLEIAHANAGRI